MTRFFLSVAALVSAMWMAGCSNGSSADPPPDLTAVAGDSQVTLTWTAQPGVEYWVFYAPVPGVTTTNWLSIGGRALLNVTPPRVISGLPNGTTHSFVVDARKNGGPAGPGSKTVEVVPRPAGVAWTVGTPLGTGRLNGVSLGVLNNVNSSVAVGAGGTIFSSSAGSTTVARTNPAAPADLNAVAVSTGGYVAVGSAGTVVFSADGLTWTAQTSGTTNNLYAVVSTGTGYVAVGAAGTIITSVDGKVWVGALSGTTKDLYAISFSGTRYVAVGAAGTIIGSADSITWAAATTTNTQDLRGIIAGLKGTTLQYAAVGAAGLVLTSADGLTWTVGTPISANNFTSIAYGSQFVAVGNAGSIYTSADALTWTRQNSGTNNDLNAITRGQGGYTAVGAAGTNVFSF